MDCLNNCVFMQNILWKESKQSSCWGKLQSISWLFRYKNKGSKSTLMAIKYTLMLLEHLALNNLVHFFSEIQTPHSNCTNIYTKWIMKMISNTVVNSFLHFQVIYLAVPGFKKFYIYVSNLLIFKSVRSSVTRL